MKSLVLLLLSCLAFGAEGELERMLARYPAADANGDGSLSEQEAMDWVVRNLWKRRVNAGPGMGDPSLVDLYEPRELGSTRYRLLRPLEIEPDRKYPLIVSLHGAGGVGDDNVSSLRHWNAVMAREEWRREYLCYVLVPQALPGANWGPRPDRPEFADVYVKNMLPVVFDIIADLRHEFPIDEKRIYALGSSMGGVGTWNILAARPEMFAGGIPVCGRMNPEDAPKLVHMPIWCFHGDADPTVSVEYSREAVATLRKLGSEIKYTEFPGVKHNSWIQAFSYDGPDGNVWNWLFGQTR